MLAFIESLIENSLEIDVARENTAKTPEFWCYSFFFRCRRTAFLIILLIIWFILAYFQIYYTIQYNGNDSGSDS